MKFYMFGFDYIFGGGGTIYGGRDEDENEPASEGEETNVIINADED